MIELKNVSKFYYQNGMVSTGFSKINLKLNVGEFVLITGVMHFYPTLQCRTSFA